MGKAPLGSNIKNKISLSKQQKMKWIDIHLLLKDFAHTMLLNSLFREVQKIIYKIILFDNTSASNT